MSDYTPTTQKVEDRYWLATVDDEGIRLRANEEQCRAEFRAWLAEHDAKVRAEAYKDAEDAAADALRTWWLRETLPEDDTDSVMDVRRAIRAARIEKEAGL